MTSELCVGMLDVCVCVCVCACVCVYSVVCLQVYHVSTDLQAVQLVYLQCVINHLSEYFIGT